MLKYVLTLALALAFGLPHTPAGAVTLRDLAGCKPGADDPIVTSTGLVTAHLVCDRLLLELPEAIYGRDLLLNTEFAALSGGSNFIAPGTVVDNRVVRFVRRGKNKVDLVMVTYEIAAARTSGLERAVEANSLPTTLRSFDVVGRGAQGEAIVDITPGFVKEPPRGFALGFMKHFGMREIDPARSYIESVKVFAENVGVRYYQTWLADRDELRSRVDVGEESVIAAAGLHVLYQPVPASREADAAALLGPAGGLLRHRFPATTARATTAVSRAASSSAIASRRRTARRCCRIRSSPIVFYIDREVPEVAPVPQAGGRGLAGRVRAGRLQQCDRRAGRAHSRPRTRRGIRTTCATT